MSWWERIGADAQSASDHPRLRDRLRRSVYEPVDVEPELPGRVEIIMGNAVRVSACCSNPSECQRAECWRPWPR